MSGIDASQLLRPGLLRGVSIVLAGARASAAGERVAGDAGAVSFASTVRDACAGLGARVSECACFDAACAAVDESATDGLADRALEQMGGLDLLAVDGAGLFAQARAGAQAGQSEARDALVACLDASWNVTRAVANRAFLPHSHGGRIVYLAPSPDAGEHADAARAGLENLARTLSIEWARHGITTVAIVPGAATAASEVAALVAYLASPAGAYFSGCLLDLRGPAAAA
jgi:NAD(P)-dependent dehydrogenase (short-subunit alcohol dehydrogenase family)